MTSSIDITEAFKKSGIEFDFDCLAADASLRKVGLDSMDIMALFLEVEQAFDIRIPDEDIMQLDSVDMIASYLNSRSSQ